MQGPPKPVFAKTIKNYLLNNCQVDIGCGSSLDSNHGIQERGPQSDLIFCTSGDVIVLQVEDEAEGSGWSFPPISGRIDDKLVAELVVRIQVVASTESRLKIRR